MEYCLKLLQKVEPLSISNKSGITLIEIIVIMTIIGIILATAIAPKKKSVKLHETKIVVTSSDYERVLSVIDKLKAASELVNNTNDTIIVKY